MPTTLEKLYDRQGRVATLMRGLVDKAAAEDRGLTADELTQWNNADADLTTIEAEIVRAKRVDGLDEQLYNEVRDYNEHRPQPGKPNKRAEGESGLSKEVREYYANRGRGGPMASTPYLDTVNGDEYVEAFRDYIRQHSERTMSSESRQILTRAAQTSTTTAGGYTIPTGMQTDIEVAMAQFGGIFNTSTIWRTPAGNPITWPTVNDTTITGRLLGENAAENNTAITFGQLTFNAYKYSSDYVLVPVELAQDTGVALEAVVGRLLGERLGRITAQHYATGTGSSQPNGLVTASVEGAVTGGAATSNLGYSDIINLVHSVDPAYRVGPGVGFVMHDATLKLLKQLQDAVSGRPLWQPAIANEVPATLDGYRYYIDQGVPQHLSNSPNGGEKVVLFGDLRKYMIRMVMDTSLTVLRELYAANHQIGYVAIMRTDADLLDAGTRPVKHLAAKA